MQVIRDHAGEALILNELEQKRSGRQGLHLSDLTGCLKKSFYRKVNPLPVSYSVIPRFTIGWAFQHELFGLEEKETEVEGVMMSADTWLETTFAECKTTRQSSKRFSVIEHSEWVLRLKGYCYGLNVKECKLVILFLNGNYSPPQAEIQVFHLKFGQEEIDDGWGQILERRAYLEKGLEDNVPPLVDYHQEWECKDCENNIPGRCWKGVVKT